ncbi:MAG TPA: MFS transporter, partial [Spirochaetota bacterium]|nr:MFS transporter [Spirochaetota bacterium]
QTAEIKKRYPFFKSIKRALTNKAFRIILLVYTFSFLALDLVTATAKYYLDDYLNDSALISPVMGTLLGTAVLFLALYRFLADRYSRRPAYIAGACIWISGFLLLFFLPAGYSNKLIMLGIMAVIGAGTAAAFIIPWSALPETVDVDLYRHNKREAGIYTGIMTFARKAAASLAILILSQTLDIAGYDAAKAQQPASMLTAIRLLITLVPGILILFTGITMYFYPVNKKIYSLLQTWIKNKKKLTTAQQQLLRRKLL